MGRNRLVSSYDTLRYQERSEKRSLRLRLDEQQGCATAKERGDEQASALAVPGSVHRSHDPDGLATLPTCSRRSERKRSRPKLTLMASIPCSRVFFACSLTMMNGLRRAVHKLRSAFTFEPNVRSDPIRTFHTVRTSIKRSQTRC
jgi:hypothetical protein